MKINTKDDIVRAVLSKMDERSMIGQKKYGQTMEDEVYLNLKNLNDFLTDTQEELMDALLYIEASKRCIAKKFRKPGSHT